MASAAREVELQVGGMTCASCAARVEKRLNRLDGVQARVNLATETGHVRHPAALPVAELIPAVEAAGYPAPVARRRCDDAPPVRSRLGGTAPLTAPLLVLSTVPAACLPYWQSGAR